MISVKVHSSDKRFSGKYECIGYHTFVNDAGQDVLCVIQGMVERIWIAKAIFNDPLEENSIIIKGLISDGYIVEVPNMTNPGRILKA